MPQSSQISPTLILEKGFFSISFFIDTASAFFGNVGIRHLNLRIKAASVTAAL